jgi:flagellar hook-associated protein 2
VSTNFISGLVSGIDTSALVEATIALKSGPIRLLESRQAETTARLSAWKSLEAMLVALKVDTDRLANADLWDDLVAASSSEETATASASGASALGAHEIFVVGLAASHQMRSQDYASSAADVGAGTFSITAGGATTDITIDAGTTLAELAELVNDEELGVTAALVQGKNDQGDDVVHLVLTGDETGTDGAIGVSSTLSGGEAPAFTTIRAAQDAHLQFGGEGGLDLYSSTNTFEDLVQGLDVTVHAVSEAGTNVIIDVSRDVEGWKDAISSFVDRYNTVVGFINDQFRYDPETGVRPVLFGEGSLAGIATRLRSWVGRQVDGTDGGAFRTLFSVGVKSGSDGSLTFDESAFTEAAERDPQALADLFRPRARFSEPGVEWISAPEDMNLAGRTVEITVTQTAEKAAILGSDVDLSAGLTIDSSNDAFRIVVNGNASETLHLAHGTYADGEDLAQAIQNAIEGSEELDRLTATVTFESSGAGTGRFVIASEREGSAETLQLLVPSGDFAADLGLAAVVNSNVAGTDAAATIDGVSVTGKGRTLTIDDPDSALDGLVFRVGAAGDDVPFSTTATFSEGVGRTFSRGLFEWTDVATGSLGRLAKSVQSVIDRMAQDIASKKERLEVERGRLLARYARLESTLAEIQGQGQFIAAQIAAMQQNNSLSNRN